MADGQIDMGCLYFSHVALIINVKGLGIDSDPRKCVQTDETNHRQFRSTHPLGSSSWSAPNSSVSDASLSGISRYLCQGDTLETSKPAVYHSRVFNSAQRNYPVHEQELLAVEDLVKSNEHLLIGSPFTVVTDSQAMLSLMKQKHLSPRQWRTVTYLSKFDIKFEFVPGKKNIIADLLSRIAERSTYKYDLPELEESDLHLNAMSLRRGKVLLEEPAIKRRPP